MKLTSVNERMKRFLEQGCSTGSLWAAWPAHGHEQFKYGLQAPVAASPAAVCGREGPEALCAARARSVVSGLLVQPVQWGSVYRQWGLGGVCAASIAYKVVRTLGEGRGFDWSIWLMCYAAPISEVGQPCLVH